MKKILVIIPFIFLLIPAVSAFAYIDKSLNNYHYIHTNKPGTNQLLSDKSNRTVINGDSYNGNGIIKRITFRLNGLDGETLSLRYPDGSKQDVIGKEVILNKDTYSIEIMLTKTTNQESIVLVDEVIVSDEDAPELIRYRYGEDPPTKWGDLGTGPKPGKPVDTYKVYYQDYRDQYRLDYWKQPSSTAQIRLKFKTATGVDYDREWPVDQVGGTLYLTCTGTYELEFLNASGTVVGFVNGISTTQIQNNVCASFPEPVPKNDLNAKVSMPACTEGSSEGLPKVKWDRDPNAESYDIYKDGQKIGNTTDTEYDLPGDGSYSVVGRDPNGNVTGESDINTPYIGVEGDGAADAICKCIEDLKPVLEEIRDNTQAIHQDLQKTNDELRQVNDNLREVIRQLTPTKQYELPSAIKMPDEFVPDNVMDKKYENKNTYFTDQGDAPTPDAMPIAPEPESWEHDGKKMKQDAEIKKEPDMQKSEEMKKDEEMTKEPDMQRDQELKKDAPLNLDAPLQVQKETYRLRWKSSEFP